MAAPASFSGLDALQCEVLVSPEIHRWSDKHIGVPALQVIPRNEHDVQAAIRIAKENDLTIVTAGGHHGSFVRIGPRTLYLDMQRFKRIYLDKDAGTVQVGGGVVSGELLRSLAADGYYTPLPNSNAVGVVGCILGGGSTAMNALHGWMADIAVSFRVVSADGRIVEVSASSTGQEQSIFQALCGAGHGLGVVTSVNTRAFPLSALHMTDDMMWTRTLIFPPPALDQALQAFLDLKNPSPASAVSLICMRSPPGTPNADSPIILLNFSYFGPGSEGEKQCAPLFDSSTVSKAAVANSKFVPIVNMNDQFEPQNKVGGFKQIASCRLERADPASIKRAFALWQSFTEQYPDARQTPLVVTHSNSAKHLSFTQADAGKSRFLEPLDRPFNVFIVAMCAHEETMTASNSVLNAIMADFREHDTAVLPRSFANNLRFETNLHEIFTPDRLAELRGIKRAWDADGVFWSPYV